MVNSEDKLIKSEITLKEIKAKEQRDRKEIKKLNYEIQLWLECPPKTLGRLKKFYNSIISIHLGGEGLMGLFQKEREKGISDHKLKLLVRNYKVNYPNKN